MLVYLTPIEFEQKTCLKFTDFWSELTLALHKRETIEIKGENMLGAVIGNIVGSLYYSEGKRIKTKEFIFFSDACHFRIDTVCTAAVADILLNNRQPATTIQAWCRRYPKLSRGKFKEWINSDVPKPYESYGNGAAMRVSPAAFLNRGSLSAALTATDMVTELTHNHPEGMKGARATTHAIWLAFQDQDPIDIRQVIATEYNYDLTQNVDEIRPGYAFDMTCEGTVPQAITCALESKNFEDAVRNAISLGGDSDTLAAIAGPIAEALHGIPPAIREQVESLYLIDAPDILEVVQKMYRLSNEKIGKTPHPIGNPIKCPNCDPEWILVGISHRFANRYAYGHINNDFLLDPSIMKYRILEPGEPGWIRAVDIDGTHNTFQKMRYDSVPLNPHWQYHKLECGCETFVFPDLKEIPNISRRLTLKK